MQATIEMNEISMVYASGLQTEARSGSADLGPFPLPGIALRIPGLKNIMQALVCAPRERLRRPAVMNLAILVHWYAFVMGVSIEAALTAMLLLRRFTLWLPVSSGMWPERESTFHFECFNGMRPL